MLHACLNYLQLSIIISLIAPEVYDIASNAPTVKRANIFPRPNVQEK